MKYILNTDFSSRNGPKTTNRIMGLQDMAGAAFADSSGHLRLLGNQVLAGIYPVSACDWSGGIYQDVYQFTDKREDDRDDEEESVQIYNWIGGGSSGDLLVLELL